MLRLQRCHLKVGSCEVNSWCFSGFDAHTLCFSPLFVPNGHPLRASSAVQHFYDKLIHVKDRLKTEPGKRMGQKRHELVSALFELNR